MATVRHGLMRVSSSSSMCERLQIAAAAMLVALALSAPVARAATTAAPAWQITTAGIPSILSPKIGSSGRYQIAIENIGAANSSGDITVRDRLPAGLRITTIINVEPGEHADECSSVVVAGASEAICTYHEPVVPAGFMSLEILYAVSGTISSLVNTVEVSGGGAPNASETNSTRPAEHENERGAEKVSAFSFQATGPAGEPFTQAAGHPTFQTTRLTLTSKEGGLGAFPEEPVKDIVFYLPLGMLGDAQAAETCPIALVETNPTGSLTGCPAASRVGTLLPFIRGQLTANTYDPTHAHGIYNVTPEHGYAAEFAFATNNYDFLVYASVVRHDGQYMLRVATPGLPQISNLIGLVASFDGDLTEQVKSGPTETIFDRGAFLTDPSDCGEGDQAREASVALNTWPASETTVTDSMDAFPALEGCSRLSLPATITAAPDPATPGDTNQADEPSGYRMDLESPPAINGGSDIANPPYKSVQVTFPQGTSLNPGAANGLTACPATGPNGIDMPQGNTLAPGVGIPGEGAGEGEAIGPDGLPAPTPGRCPGSSVVATVTATTSLLAEQLRGHLYLAEPGCGNAAHNRECTPQDAADGNLFGLYLELEAPQRGVIVKLAGSAHVDPDTGQVKAVFEEIPQFPVSDIVIETTGGPRASLANPQMCGTATTTGLVTPWSPETVAAKPSASFNVLWAAGSPCPAASPFTPAVSAGTTSSNAGAYSPFTLVLKREDREQDIQSVTTALPPGLLAAVSHVTQCEEPAIAENQCPASSRVGSTTVAIGSGSAPFYQSGQVYLTGPYGGAPFGLSVVVPAVAGPFNLGDVTVRVALHINPETAQVTALSSPLPQIIDGVPLRIRTIALMLDAPAFTFNPTSCTPSSIDATVTATQGASAATSVPYQASGCEGLPFKPKLTATTQGKVSKANGASLAVKITSAQGQANIGKVDLTLPIQFPTRDSTLKQACTEAQFVANPAGCPEGSNIGVAKAITPLLNVPLTGPAYLISHGGAAFPDVVFVLQGEGVRIDIDGKTDIKGGITYSRFETVPDAPISSFETVLPEGPHSVLGINSLKVPSYDLCGQSLQMPTAITGQNGAVLKQTTKIAVTGCTAKVAVTKRKTTAKTLSLTLSTSVAGLVSVTGAGLEPVKRSLAAGSHSILVHLTARGRSARRRHRSMTARVALSAGRATATTRVRF